MMKMTPRRMASMLMLCGASLFFFSCMCCCNRSAAGFACVSGTLDATLPLDSAPPAVLEAIERAERFHCYEIMCQSAHAICVEAIAEVDTMQTEGYGIVVEKGAASTTFPNLRHSRSPMARYVETESVLWLSCSAMEGTGVTVERLYQIRFDEGDKAYIAQSIDPYDLQQQLCQRLGFRIEGEQVTLYDGGREIAQATNTMTDMGGFDHEQPLWIGEQMCYDLSGDVPRLLFTPGLKFSAGPVLIYDDMPTLMAPLTITEGGMVSLGDFTVYDE